MVWIRKDGPEIDPSKISKWIVPNARPQPLREPQASDRPAPKPLPTPPDPSKK